MTPRETSTPSPAAPARPPRRYVRWAIPVTAIAILAAGLWTSWRFGRSEDQRQRHFLLEQAASVALAVDPHDARALTFTAADAGSPEFQRLGSQMRAYARAMGRSGRCWCLRT